MLIIAKPSLPALLETNVELAMLIDPVWVMAPPVKPEHSRIQQKIQNEGSILSQDNIFFL